jgi:hypothetical protein
MFEKVKKALIENEYQTAKQLAERCHLRTCSIFRIIKNMRLNGIGVLPTKKGYVLSEFATKNDDVGFIRRCYGRRTSDMIAIQAARSDINRRWKGVEQATLKTLLGPLVVDLSKNSKFLLNYK